MKLSVFENGLIRSYSVSSANNAQQSTKSNKTVFEYREFHKQLESCANPDSGCASVDLWYPEIISTPNMAAKNSINKYLKEVLINGPPAGVVYDAQRSKKLDTFDEVVSELFSDYSEYL